MVYYLSNFKDYRVLQSIDFYRLIDNYFDFPLVSLHFFMGENVKHYIALTQQCNNSFITEYLFYKQFFVLRG